MLPLVANGHCILVS